MTIFPSPNLGRSPFLRTPFDFIAVQKSPLTVGGVTRWEPDFRASKDGMKWRKLKAGGDILQARRYGEVGIFNPQKVLFFKGRWVIVGALNAPLPSFQSRAAVYVRNLAGDWMRADLPNDFANPNGSGIVDAVVTDDYLIAVGMNGVLFYWNGVDAWQSRIDLPMGASITTNRHVATVTATTGGAVVVAGAYSNANSTAGALRLISAPSVTGAFTVRSVPSMEGLSLAARGNVLLVASYTSPNALQRITGASLSDLSTWSAAGLAVDGALEYLAYNGVRWISGGGYNKQHFKSANGSAGWSAVADQALSPWGVTPDERPVVNSMVAAGGKFLAHWGHYVSPNYGGLSLSDDGENWQRISSAEAGFPGVRYLLGASL